MLWKVIFAELKYMTEKIHKNILSLHELYSIILIIIFCITFAHRKFGLCD